MYTLNTSCAVVSIISLLFISGCSEPLESSVNPAGTNRFEPLPKKQPVQVFSKVKWSKEALKDAGQAIKPFEEVPPHTVVASITVNGAQVTSLRTMIEEAKRQARLSGANAIILVEELRPVIYSPISGEPRARARVFKFDAVRIN
jgi:hypothetical protein